jgi:hypothetical protein
MFVFHKYFLDLLKIPAWKILDYLIIMRNINVFNTAGRLYSDFM